MRSFNFRTVSLFLIIKKMELNMPETNLDEAYQEKPVTFGNENPCVNCKS